MVVKRRSLLVGQGAERAQKGLGGVGERGLAAADQPQNAPHLQFVHGNATRSPVSSSRATVMWGTSATPLPMATKRLMASMVGSSMPMLSGVR